MAAVVLPQSLQSMELQSLEDGEVPQLLQSLVEQLGKMNESMTSVRSQMDGGFSALTANVGSLPAMRRQLAQIQLSISERQPAPQFPLRSGGSTNVDIDELSRVGCRSTDVNLDDEPNVDGFMLSHPHSKENLLEKKLTDLRMKVKAEFSVASRDGRLKKSLQPAIASLSEDARPALQQNGAPEGSTVDNCPSHVNASIISAKSSAELDRMGSTTSMSGTSSMNRKVAKLRLKDCWDKAHRKCALSEMPHGVEDFLTVTLSNALANRPSKLKIRQTGAKPVEKEKRQSVKCTCIIHPVGRFKIFWSALTILSIVYDILTVPLSVFPLQAGGIFYACDWAVCLFWTFDIPVSFRTAFYQGADIEERPAVIAKIYVRNWLLPDTIITALGWFGLIVGATGAGTLLRVTRSTRAIRTLRLLRLAKLMSASRMIEDHFNSLAARLCLVLCKLTIGLITLIHLATCGWYWLGETSHEGWVNYLSVPECATAKAAGPSGTPAFVSMVPAEFSDTTFLYFHSARWVLAQMNGRTDQDSRRNLFEMAYTCIVAVVGPLILMSVFVSSVTQNMLELSNISTETRANRMLLETYLTDKKISQELVSTMKMHARYYKDIEKQIKVEEGVMAMLTKQMRRDLLYEVRAPTLVAHPLFYFINHQYSQVMLHLTAHTVQSLPVHEGEHVFEQGDTCNHMLFSQRGRFLYGQRPEEESNPKVPAPLEPLIDAEDWTLLMPPCGQTPLKPASRNPTASTEFMQMSEGGQFESQLFKLKTIDNASWQAFDEGAWICEAALWLEWRNRGTLLSRSEGCFLALDAAMFAKSLRAFPDTLALSFSYAKQFEEEHENNPSLTDLIGIQISIGEHGKESGTTSGRETEIA